MKKILIIGMSDNIGGTETFFHNYYEYFDLKKYHFDFVTVCGTIAFADEYESNGSVIYKLPHFLKHPFKYYKELRKIMRDNHYDVVHINMLSAANILPAKAALKESIQKVIVHSHNTNVPRGFLRRLLHHKNKKILRNSDLIKLACGESAGKWLFGNDTNFCVVNNAFNIDKFKFNVNSRERIRKKYGIYKDEFLLGNVGRICEQKNQQFLVDVLAKIQNKNVKLMIVGNDAKGKDLKTKIKSLGLEGRVIFVPPTDSINEYYNAFDAFVLPSRFEGMPVALVEAQANGLDILVSDKVFDFPTSEKVTILSIDSTAQWARKIEDLADDIVTSKTRSIMLPNSFDIRSECKKLSAIYGGKIISHKANKVKLSIIVPVYNAEKYLRKCLLSIMNQTLEDIEIICVNDGSTDSSLKIIKELASNDKRLVVVDQENQGVIAARKNGYDNATGEYVAWVDNDDFLEPNMYEKLYELAKKEDSDIVVCNYKLYPKNTFKKDVSYKAYEGKVTWEFMLKNAGTPWNKISKKAFLDRYKVNELFDNLGECTFGVLLGLTNKVATVDTPLYNYRVGHTSASNSYSNINWYESGVEWVRRQYEYSKKHNFSKELQDYFLYSYLYYNLVLMTVAAKNCDKEKYESAKSIISSKQIFQKKNEPFFKEHFSSTKRLFFRMFILPNYSLAHIMTRMVLR